MQIMSIELRMFLGSLLFAYVGGTQQVLRLMGGATASDKQTQPWPSTGNKNVLVTGGAGYIGTHTIVTLIEAGYDVTVVDNLMNANEESLRRVMEITGCASERIRFYKADLCDLTALEAVFQDSHVFDSCIHFAGLKAVGESVRLPVLYYDNNLRSTTNLLTMMDKYGCRNVVFSSSATVYGSASVPITEATPAGHGITNAYGRTKHMIEEVLAHAHVHMCTHAHMYTCTHAHTTCASSPPRPLLLTMLTHSIAARPHTPVVHRS